MDNYKYQIATYLSGGLLEKFEADKKKLGYTNSELAREIVLTVLSQWEESEQRKNGNRQEHKAN